MIGKRHLTYVQRRWFWRQARFEAALTMKKLVKAGVVSPDEVHANEALKVALSVMRGPTDQKNQLTAAALVLAYTKAKPASKSEITVSKAEEWLEAVTADNEHAKDALVTYTEETSDPEETA
jgi:hypothetical protein